MIGILGGMGTQAGLDFCNKLAVLNRGKIDQEYPLFILYNKSNIPGRPESIGVQTKNLSNRFSNNTSKKKYQNVLKSLLQGCRLLEKNKCKFIVMPCNTAHYWHEDIQKKIKIPLLSMPKEVFLHFILINSLIAGCIVFAAALTLPILTILIALFTDFFCWLCEV